MSGKKLENEWRKLTKPLKAPQDLPVNALQKVVYLVSSKKEVDRFGVFPLFLRVKELLHLNSLGVLRVVSVLIIDQIRLI